MREAERARASELERELKTLTWLARRSDEPREGEFFSFLGGVRPHVGREQVLRIYLVRVKFALGFFIIVPNNVSFRPMKRAHI